MKTYFLDTSALVKPLSSDAIQLTIVKGHASHNIVSVLMRNFVELSNERGLPH